jgi:hypothetical protein
VKLIYGQWRWSWNDSTCLDNLPQFVEEKGPEGRPALGVLIRTDRMRNVFVEKWRLLVKMVLVAGVVLFAMIGWA